MFSVILNSWTQMNGIKLMNAFIVIQGAFKMFQHQSLSSLLRSRIKVNDEVFSEVSFDEVVLLPPNEVCNQ